MTSESALTCSRYGNTLLRGHLAFSPLASPLSVRAPVTIDSKPAALAVTARVQVSKMGTSVRGSKAAHAVCFASCKLCPRDGFVLVSSDALPEPTLSPELTPSRLLLLSLSPPCTFLHCSSTNWRTRSWHLEWLWLEKKTKTNSKRSFPCSFEDVIYPSWLFLNT